MFRSLRNSTANGYFLHNKRPERSLLRFYTSNSAQVNRLNEWFQTLNDVDRRKIRYYQNEMLLGKLESVPTPDPDSLAISDYQKLLELSNNQRKSYYRFLYKNQSDKKDKKLEHVIEVSIFGQDPKRHYEPDVSVNKLLPRFSNQTINRWKYKRLFHEMMFDQQELIFDCSFEREMTSRENDETAKQLAQSFHRNRDHRSPFIMHLYNLKAGSLLHRNLLRYIPMLESDSMPIRISACDYTDAHDTDELVVLTNESSSPLRLLEPNRHYVLGACVKLSNQNRFVHAKAKSQNVQTARIPFDLYCSFRASKLLPLHHLAQILLEFKYSGNWAKAFEFIERHRLK